MELDGLAIWLNRLLLAASGHLCKRSNIKIIWVSVSELFQYKGKVFIQMDVFPLKNSCWVGIKTCQN